MVNSDTGCEVNPSDIAIIGMAGRFPGAKNIEQFWKNLCQGIEAKKEVTKEDLLAAGVNPGELDLPGYVKTAFTLEDFDCFDAVFFGYTTKEAKYMDPQQRVFLECAWEALEHAGYDPERYPGLIGIFAGTGSSTYFLNNIYPHFDPRPSLMELHETTFLNNPDHLTTRVAYKLNLKGPALTIQGGCATSLAAVVIALQSLLLYQCDIALAGGVKIDVPQKVGYRVTPDMKGIFSSDGSIRAFSLDADGLVPGNGVGLVVLKRLEEALADQDTIHAVIKSAFINNDGSSKVGFTAPSLEGQVRALRGAYEIAGIDPKTIAYIETHGTGTHAGDLIEMGALNRALGPEMGTRKSCAIGSVKTNIGHLDPAAGAAGLIKTVMALKHRLIPASLNFNQPNPEIDFEAGPFYVNTQLKDWTADNHHPRRAGVSACGVGGTNVHVVVEEFTPGREPVESKPWHLLTLTAKNKKALAEASEAFLAHLRESPGINLADVAYTLALGRKEFDYRRMLVCKNREEAVEILKNLPKDRVFGSVPQPGQKKVIFLFPGLESQGHFVGRELYRTHPTFREQVDRCARILQTLLNLDLRRFFSMEKETLEEEYKRHASMPVAMGMLFSCEYALATLWTSWGVCPQGMLGHSLGEYTAACLAGVFSLEDALKLVVFRGELFEAMAEGAMTTAALPEEKANCFLNPHLSLAAVNAPYQCVFSGTREAVETLEQSLTREGIGFSRLEVSRAGHSPLVTPSLMEKFKEFFKTISLRPPGIPYISSLTGTWLTGEEAVNPDYWALQLRSTVRFSQGIRELLQDPSGIFLEIGMGRTLSAFVKRHKELARDRIVLTSTLHSKQQQSETRYLYETLGKLWLAGVPIDWQKFYKNEKCFRIPLPTYPFQRQGFWIHPPVGQGVGTDSAAGFTTTQRQENNGGFGFTSYKRSMALTRDNAAADFPGETWWILSDSWGLGDALVELLPGKNVRSIVVKQGPNLKADPPFDYVLDPGKPENHEALLNTITPLPERIIDLWNFFDGGGSEKPGFHLPILAQTLKKSNTTGLKEIVVVTNNHCQVTGEEALSPSSVVTSALLAYVSGDPLSINTRRLDLSITDFSPGQLAWAARQIMFECRLKTHDPIAAYRGTYRWLPQLEVLPDPPLPGSINKIRETGVYLVSGGLEETGYECAQYLASHMTAEGKLILLETVSPGNEAVGKELCTAAGTRYFDFNPEETVGNASFPGIKPGEDRFLKRINQLEIQMPLKRVTGEAEACSEKLAALYILEYFQGKNIKTAAGCCYTKKALREKLGIPPGTYQSFFNFFLETLGQFSWLKEEGDDIEFLKDPGEIPSAALVRQQLAEDYPEFGTICRAAEYFIAHYDRLFSGEVDGMEVMYPGGKSELIREGLEIFTESTNRPVYARLMAETILEAAERLPQKKVRILEIGAGEGLITWEIARFFKNKNIEYCFTDIGKSFVIEARRNAQEREIDFMTFGVLDIAENPAAQGYDLYSFDFIISFNVIHATRNIGKSLEHIRELLKPGGLTFLLETIKLRPMVGLILGIMEGWWIPLEDKEARLANTPFLNVPLWVSALKEAGFKEVNVYPPGSRQQLEDSFVMLTGQQPAEPVSEDYLEWKRDRDEKNRALLGQKVEKIKSLKSPGPGVVLVNIDMASAAQVERLKREVLEKYGPVSGIIHTDAYSSFSPAKSDKMTDYRLKETLEWIQTTTRALLNLQSLIPAEGCDPGFLFSSFDPSISPGLAFEKMVSRYLFEHAAANNRRGGEYERVWTHIHWQGGLTREALGRLFSLEMPGPFIVSIPGCDEAGSLGFSPEITAGTEEPLEPAVDTQFPSRGHLQSEYVEPANEREREIAEIWQEEFGESRIGIYDDFFELGGESLLALKVNAKMQQRFKVKISIKDLFQHPTIAELAKVVEKNREQNRDSSLAAQEEMKSADREKYRVKKSALNL